MSSLSRRVRFSSEGQQGGAVVAQLAHNQKVPGANPGPATDGEILYPGREMANTYEYVKRSVTARVKWMQNMKRKACGECGRTYPIAQMHWHHRNPSTKLFSLGRGAYRHSREKILAEIEKCNLLCVDCHNERHLGTKQQ